VSGKLGSPLTLRLTDDEGHSAGVCDIGVALGRPWTLGCLLHLRSCARLLQLLLVTLHPALHCCSTLRTHAAADSGDVLLSAAVKRALSGADVEAAVGKLGDNTLAPANIDMSALDLDAGGHG
jgi:hypothetical protein